MKNKFLVVGSGVSGLICALKLAPRGEVWLLSKGKISHGNSALAQGGISAVSDQGDSLESHFQDTLAAGAGLCDPEIVRQVVAEGPERIEELLKWGVAFDKNSDTSHHLHREGGHSSRRIFHIGDHTGAALHHVLADRVERTSNIRVLESHFALELLTETTLSGVRCLGLTAWDDSKKLLRTLWADSVVLATGGAGRVFRYTSNWEGATGDGIAMAYQAGAKVANMEFIQFHPTCLYHPEDRNFLISEAVRGEGARLVTVQGEEFVPYHHPLGALAPRDIVARAMDEHLKLTGEPCVFLDATHLGESLLKKNFPEIFRRCSELGINISNQPIPVVPAAHYLCGGIASTLSGQTSVSGLYAIGECAHTGLHGANRLASNSLLECLVMAHRCAEEIPYDRVEPGSPGPEMSEARQPPGAGYLSALWTEIRSLMWDEVGLVRSTARLETARQRLGSLGTELTPLVRRESKEVAELLNLHQVATLIVESALKRKESRGAHCNLDFPDQVAPKDTVLERG